MFRTASVLTGLIVILFSGCSAAGNAPAVKTIAVSGKVLDAGGKPVSGGMLSLRSTANAEQVASAVVDKEGAFKLTSVVGDKQLDGAQPGEYSVMYAPASVDQTLSDAGLPVTLKKTYSIKDGQEELEINLE